MVKFRFNAKACQTLADQLRKASWGIGALGAFVQFQVSAGWVLLLGVLAWSLLQGLAFVLDSLLDD